MFTIPASFLTYELTLEVSVRNNYLGDYIHIRALSFPNRNAIPRVCPLHFDHLYAKVWRFALVGWLVA